MATSNKVKATKTNTVNKGTKKMTTPKKVISATPVIPTAAQLKAIPAAIGTATQLLMKAGNALSSVIIQQAQLAVKYGQAGEQVFKESILQTKELYKADRNVSSYYGAIAQHVKYVAELDSTKSWQLYSIVGAAKELHEKAQKQLLVNQQLAAAAAAKEQARVTAAAAKEEEIAIKLAAAAEKARKEAEKKLANKKATAAQKKAAEAALLAAEAEAETARIAQEAAEEAQLRAEEETAKAQSKAASQQAKVDKAEKAKAQKAANRSGSGSVIPMAADTDPKQHADKVTPIKVEVAAQVDNIAELAKGAHAAVSCLMDATSKGVKPAQAVTDKVAREFGKLHAEIERLQQALATK